MDEEQQEMYNHEFNLAKTFLNVYCGVENLTNIEGFYLAGKIRDFVLQLNVIKSWGKESHFQFADEAVARFWFELYGYELDVQRLEKDSTFRVFERKKKGLLGRCLIEFKNKMEAEKFELGDYKHRTMYISLPEKEREHLQKIREESYLL